MRQTVRLTSWIADSTVCPPQGYWSTTYRAYGARSTWVSREDVGVGREQRKSGGGFYSICLFPTGICHRVLSPSAQLPPSVGLSPKSLRPLQSLLFFRLGCIAQNRESACLRGRWQVTSDRNLNQERTLSEGSTAMRERGKHLFRHDVRHTHTYIRRQVVRPVRYRVKTGDKLQ